MGFMQNYRFNNLMGMANEVFNSDYEGNEEDQEDEVQDDDMTDENEQDGLVSEYGGLAGMNNEEEEEEDPLAQLEEENPGILEKMEKERQWKIDRQKMQIVAALFGAKQAKQFKCPRCKRPSIYFEPPIIKEAMDAAWEACYLFRVQRWVCFNPRCPMNFIQTRTRFRLGITQPLVATHIFSDIVDQNPIIPKTK